MPEPLSEEAEVSWLEFLNRFEQVIYPTLFADRNISKETALLIWSANQTRDCIAELLEKLAEGL